MSEHETYFSPAGYLDEYIIFLHNHRKKLKRSERLLRCGINYSLILTAGCMLESSLEFALRTLTSHRYDVITKLPSGKDYENCFKMAYARNMKTLLESEIRRASGMTKLIDLFETLSVRVSPIKTKDFSDWESIKVFITFRNVLAHGREANFKEIEKVNLNIHELEYSGGV